MRRVPESEIESDFERDFAWGDDERHLHNPNRRKAAVLGYFLRLDLVLSLVKKHARGKQVADLACAQGNFGLMLAERGYDVTAVDINEDFLKYARKKHTHGSFNTINANVIEYRDRESYDCVLMGEIIEHCAYPKDLLTSAYENLKPGGILVLTTPNGEEYEQQLPTFSEVKDPSQLIPKQWHWGDHLFLFTENELRSLLGKVGFKCEELVKFNSQYVSQIKGLRYLLPLSALKWLEERTRNWKRGGKDSAACIAVVARKPS